MSGKFGVDLEKLASIIEQMSEFSDRAQQLITATDSEVHRLHLTFTGEAATAHAAAHAKWTKGAQEMRDALAVLHGAGKVAHTNYTHAVTKNTTMWA